MNFLSFLYWHKNGFCLWIKQLEQERFAWPPSSAAERTHSMTVRELEWLLEGFDLWANKPHKSLQYQYVA